MTGFTLEIRDLNMAADRVLISELNFSARSGEIHGIIGNNGEGKTVFAQVLAGFRPGTSGDIILDGRKLKITDPVSAQRNGIYMLTQKLNIFPELSVRDNLISGNEQYLYGKRFFSPSHKEITRTARDILKKYDLDFDLWQKAGSLDESDQRLLQLAHILICRPRVLILDEFSTFLSYDQTQKVFGILEELKTQDTAVILITHNYSEILRYCDHVSIITDGTVTADFSRDEFETEEFRTQITNMHMNFRYPHISLPAGEEILRFDSASLPPLSEISFSLHRKEIIGITGLSKPERKRLTQHIMEHCSNSCLLPERDSDDLLFNLQEIPFNIAASDFRKVRKMGFVSAAAEKHYSRNYIVRLGIHNADIHTPVRYLSSGNKQKLLIARSLFNNSQLYIYDDPTKNLDAASRLELYNILNALALKGASILILSSDIPELIGMCSRIILFKAGRQTGNYSTDYLSSEMLYKQL